MQTASRRFVVLGVFAVAITAVAADNPPASRSANANYELASKWTPAKTAKLVFDTAVTPHWLEEGDRFWYSFENSQGRKFWIVDPVKKSRSYIFDPAKMASQLTVATGLPYDSQHLPICQPAAGGAASGAGRGGEGGGFGGAAPCLRFVKNDTAIQFEISVPRDAVITGEKPPSAAQQRTETQEPEADPQQQGGRGRGGAAASPNKQLTFEYELASGKLTLLAERPQRKPAWASVAPDGSVAVYVKNRNLYMMDAANLEKAKKNANDATIVETQLTTDGVEDFAYGGRGGAGGDQIDQQQNEQQGEGQGQQNRNARSAANVSWSRDSKKFAIVRRDQRKLQQLWVINSLANPRPTLDTYRYAMPGDVNAPQFQPEVFDVASKARLILKADAFKDQQVSFEAERPTAKAREHEKTEPLWVNPGSDKIYFTRLSRDMHRLDLCVADTATGEVKPLIQERMNVYLEDKPLRIINNGAEMIWWSERDGWGHYYLYDTNGTLKNQITKGEFVAEDISWVDEKGRAMYLTASGHEDGEDPYFMHFYRANLDGSGMKLLDPGDASHTVTMSDSGKVFIDTSSRVDTAPKSVLVGPQGEPLLPLESVDPNRLQDAGFRFPEPFKVKADDGVTDLYGTMYKPFDFDPNKKYPIIEYVYPGPQTESVTKTFTPRSNNIMLANMGIIVIEVGNRGGNPHRSKWYHTFGYGNLRDYGLADKKAAVEQLAARYPWIDIDRVGIWGHSGGGFMSAAAILEYPDFFKVAFSESGNHENNIYNNTWSEKHHGLKEVTGPDGKVTFEYSVDKNSDLAKNLKGHLMLVTGDYDNNVHPANTFRLADALIRAGKRFDMLVLPGQRHSYGPDTDYVNWARCDYFAQYLLGARDQSVDMVELVRERAQNEKTAAGAGAGAGVGAQRQQQQQQQRQQQTQQQVQQRQQLP